MSQVRLTDKVAEGRRVNSLDGVRGICCLLVVGHHFGLPGCLGGWIGVEMFFVLSGFLITTLLCREKMQTGQIKLNAFWLRRFLRLMPIYWLYAIFITLAVLISRDAEFKSQGFWTPGTYLLSIWVYFHNFAPGHLWTHQLWTAHLWSLSKEEQFYLCWPVLLVMCSKAFASAWIVPAALAMFGILGRILHLDGLLGMAAGYIPMGMSAGCLVAMVFSINRSSSVAHWLLSKGTRWVLAAICVGLLVILEKHTQQVGNDAARGWASNWIVPLLVFPFALLVASLWHGTPALLDRLFSIQPLPYIGVISYGIYLYHIALIAPIRSSLERAALNYHFHIRFAVVSAVYLGILIGIASLSYFFIERPIMRVRKWFQPRAMDVSPVSIRPPQLEAPTSMEVDHSLAAAS